MKVLITGVSSSIGIYLSERLLSDSHHVIGFDVNRSKALPENVRFVHGDVRDQNALNHEANGCDAGIHLAVLATGSEESDIMSVNTQGAYAFLRAAKKSSFKTTVLASSAPVHLPPTESDNAILLPTSNSDDHLYDLTKSLQEVIARDYHAHGLAVLCLRFGHIVLGNDETNLKKTQALNDLDYCRGGWVALEDVVEACAAALTVFPSPTNLEILNIVGSIGTRERFCVDETERRLGIKIKYKFEDYQ